MDAFPRFVQADLGQLTVRRPTAKELAGRVPIVVTDRDVDLLAAVSTHGFLTVDLLDPARFREAAWRWADCQDSPLLLSTASSPDHSPR